MSIILVNRFGFLGGLVNQVPLVAITSFLAELQRAAPALGRVQDANATAIHLTSIPTGVPVAQASPSFTTSMTRL
jgi:hypothetical protein